MSTTRIFAGGAADLAGRTVNTLKVSDIVSRHPLRWRVVCQKCGAVTTEAHQKLTNGAARCMNGGCGKDAARAATTETLGKFRSRTASKEAAKQREREEAEAARVAEAGALLTELSSKVARTIKERIASQRDDEAYLSPAMQNASMSEQEAIQFITAEYRKFTAASPWYHDTPNNRTELFEYMTRNNIRIPDAETLSRAARRLADFGLLPDEKPAPEPPKPKPVEANLTIEAPAPKPTDPETFIGRDPLTGRTREYTAVEVERLTADEFKRIFRLGTDELRFPNHSLF